MPWGGLETDWRLTPPGTRFCPGRTYPLVGSGPAQPATPLLRRVGGERVRGLRRACAPHPGHWAAPCGASAALPSSMYKLCTVNVYLLWSAVLKRFTRSHLYFQINNLRVFSLRLCSASSPRQAGRAAGRAPLSSGPGVWGLRARLAQWDTSGSPHFCSTVLQPVSQAPGHPLFREKREPQAPRLLRGWPAGSCPPQCTWEPPLPSGLHPPPHPLGAHPVPGQHQDRSPALALAGSAGVAVACRAPWPRGARAPPGDRSPAPAAPWSHTGGPQPLPGVQGPRTDGAKVVFLGSQTAKGGNQRPTRPRPCWEGPLGPASWLWGPGAAPKLPHGP